MFSRQKAPTMIFTLVSTSLLYILQDDLDVIIPLAWCLSALRPLTLPDLAKWKMYVGPCMLLQTGVDSNISYIVETFLYQP